LHKEISERLVSRLWQSNPVLYPVADTGEWLHIIFPGRLSTRPGSDFEDAVIGMNGRIVTGDVEIHVKSSQWRTHRHHQDPKYNNIVLHVVWLRDNRTPVILQNGRTVPTLCLAAYRNKPTDELLGSPAGPYVLCPISRGHHQITRIQTILTDAGIERFQGKVDSYCKALDVEGAEQVLYRGIARALGYTQNAEPFQELAQMLPLDILRAHGESKLAVWQALLLGYAGLLPSQRNKVAGDRTATRLATRLEDIWKSASVIWTMQETDWRFFRVRPDNFPTRRIIALSRILSRYRSSGLLSGSLRLVEKTPLNGGHRWLETGLVVSSPGYWETHFDFGVNTSRASSLIGYERASAIALNVLLPFTAAWGKRHFDARLINKAVQLYGGYPARGDNELIRFMRQQLRLEANFAVSACQQQGLIHLFNNYCRYRNCLDCPVAVNRG